MANLTIVRRLPFLPLLIAPLIACNAPEQGYVVVVEDQGHLFDQPAEGAKTHAGPSLTHDQVEQRITALSLAKHADVLVRTEPAVGAAKDGLAVYADDLFALEPAWSSDAPSDPLGITEFLRSAGLISRPGDESIEFIVLTSPRLVTIRFGDSTRVRAAASGFLDGPRFRAIQQHGLQDPRAAFGELLSAVERDLPDSSHEPWQVTISRTLQYPVADAFVNWLAVDNSSLYQRLLLGPALHAENALAARIPPKIAPLEFILVCLLLVATLRRLAAIGLARMRMRGLGMVLDMLLLVVSIVPAVGLLLMLTRTRLEDRWLLDTLLNGVPLVHGTGGAVPYDSETGVLLAIPLGLLGCLYRFSTGFKWMILGRLPWQRQWGAYHNAIWEEKMTFERTVRTYDPAMKIEQQTPFTSVALAIKKGMPKTYLKYVLCLAYLPLAVSLVLAARLFADSLVVVASHWRFYRRYREQRGTTASEPPSLPAYPTNHVSL